MKEYIIFYDEIIKYLEKNYNKIENDGSTRINTLKSLLKKYIRTIKTIKILDINNYYKEGDILVRTLVEMVINIGYLELDANENYERYNLFADYELYEYVELNCNINNQNINDVKNIDIIKNNHDLYLKKYGKKSNWSGLNIKDQAIKVDKELNDINKIMSFEKMYNIIYKYICFNSHNSGVVSKYYEYLNLDASELEFNLYNINNIVIITAILTRYCLNDIFKESTDVFEKFDSYLEMMLNNK